MRRVCLTEAGRDDSSITYRLRRDVKSLAEKLPGLITFGTTSCPFQSARARYTSAFDQRSGTREQIQPRGDEKSRLFAYCVAQTLEPQLPQQDRASPVAEAVGERLGIDFRAFWTPDADTYWSRVKKDFALDQAEAVLGRKWRDEHARLKKKDLAPILGAIFSGEEAALGPFDDATRQAVLAWTPPGMGYGEQANASGAVEYSHEDGNADAGVSALDTDEDANLPAFLTADGPDMQAAE